MNKTLFEKVKSLCKDTGLSEKYLQAITDKLGGSVADDSTDEAAIEEAANLVADVAKESQSEATRWANKKSKQSTSKDKDDDASKDVDSKDKDKDKPDDSEADKRLKALEEKLAEYEAKEAKSKRGKDIAEALEKHKIPRYLRERLAKSISDDEDIEEAVSALKQDLITNGLVADETEGGKTASQKQVDDAAEDLLKSLTTDKK